MHIDVRLMEKGDAGPLSAAFEAVGWHKPVELFERYLAQQADGKRTALLALADGEPAGYLTVNWRPRYRPLHAEGYPEIQDFNVLPQYRRRGIGTLLMDIAEGLAQDRSPVVGIGVGLYADYGAAQVLYVRRGYVPDGQGVTTCDVPVHPGHSVCVDDNLVLHFLKELRSPKGGAGA